MKKHHAINLAVEVQIRKRDAVAGQLTATQNDLEAARAQLAQLDHYAGDTAQAWAQPGLSHSAARVQHHPLFMNKLQTAVDFQREVIAGIERRMDLLRSQLMAAGQRIAALEGVLAAHHDERQRALQRMEQRYTDEMASLRYVHRDNAQYAN